MGDRESNDSVRTSVRADRSQNTNNVREDESLADSSSLSPDKSRHTDEELGRELARVALRLRAIYGTALATELALRQQNAESDIDFAECLRWNVCAAIEKVAEEIQSIVAHLAEHVRHPPP